MIITRHFRAICLVGLCCIAALICYMITQRVSLERRALLHTEREILNLQQTIRHLQTEKDTLARSGQIDRWNAEAFALVSPTINQFISEDAQLAMQDNAPEVGGVSHDMAAHNGEAGFRQANYIMPAGHEADRFPAVASYKKAAPVKNQMVHSTSSAKATLAPPAPASVEPQTSARIFSSDMGKIDNGGMTKISALSFKNNHYSKIQAVR